MDELTREFLIESQEGLDRMERCLTDLEERPQDAALLGEIFRSVHTIKGTTGFLGFKRLEKLAHAGENLLGLLRDGKMIADAAVITGLLQLLDGLRAILKTIETEGGEGTGDDSALIERLEELQAPVRARKPVHAKAGKPSAQEQFGIEPPAPNPVAPETAAPAALATPAPSAPALSKPVSEQAEATSAASAPTSAAPDAGKGRTLATGTAAESTLRVDVTLLNRMMNLVGELVLTRNQVLQATAADPNMTLLSRRLDMVTADLRETVMKARMQPVSNIFSKMPRMVRDLSQSLGRRVAAADGGPGDGTRQEPARGHQGSADSRGAQLARSRHRAARGAPGRGQGPGGNSEAARQRRRAATSSSRSPTTAPALPSKRCARRPSSAG